MRAVLRDRSATCEKSLSHAGFCNIVEFGAAIATTARGAPRDRARHTRSLLDAAPLAARRRPARFAFFLLCCSNQRAVQLDSRLHGIASLIMARRAEWRRKQSRRRSPLRRRPRARPRSGVRRRRSNASSARASSLGEDGSHNRRGRGAVRRFCLAGSGRRRRASAKSRSLSAGSTCEPVFVPLMSSPRFGVNRQKSGGGKSSEERQTPYGASTP